ncbi:MAG: hypothetical protein OXB97_09190, partial [Rhodospirillales bacterium]|nr:hypothetical protein [Rhodospirillales bacterium]
YSRIAQTAIWHLGVAIHELWRRTRAGFPPAVWSHQSVGMAPDHSAIIPIKTTGYEGCTTIRTTNMKALNDATWRFLKPAW